MVLKNKARLSQKMQNNKDKALKEAFIGILNLK